MPFLGLSGLKLYIVLGMVLVIAFLTATVLVLGARLDAKEAELTSKAEQLELAAGDVARYQAAYDRQSGINRRQAEQIRRLESDRAAADAIAAEALDRARRRASAVQSQLDALRRAAHDHPEDVRDLGPIVRDALPGLRRLDLPAGAAAPGD